MLELYSTSLSGSVPSELSSLTVLTTMSFSPMTRLATLQHTSMLSGSVPSSLASLTALTTMLISDAKLSGSIPASYAMLTLLARLQLGDNRISCTLPASALSRRSGGLPIATPTLVLIQVSNNAISGTIPLTFLGHDITQSLEKKYLSVNRISGSLPSEFGAAVGMTQLQIHDTQISGCIPESYSNLTRLQGLFLQHNSLSSSIPENLHKLKDIQYFVVSRNQFSGTVSQNFGNMTKMIAFFIQYNYNLEVDMTILTHWPGIRHVSMERCNINGMVPSSMLSQATVLQTLLINNLKISGTLPENLFENATVLEYLDISHNLISGSIPSSACFCNLKTFQANNLMLTGKLDFDYDPEKLQVFAGYHNYLSGSSMVLNSGSAMTTLIMSANFFECDAVQLPNSTGLGQGTFKTPRHQAQIAIEAYHDDSHGSLDSHESLDNPFKTAEFVEQRNIVMVYPGNVDLYQTASFFNREEPSNVDKKDLIKNGNVGLFSSNAEFKATFFIVLPALVFVHLLCVYVSLNQDWMQKVFKFWMQKDQHDSNEGKLEITSGQGIVSNKQVSQLFEDVCMQSQCVAPECSIKLQCIPPDFSKSFGDPAHSNSSIPTGTSSAILASSGSLEMENFPIQIKDAVEEDTTPSLEENDLRELVAEQMDGLGERVKTGMHDAAETVKNMVSGHHTHSYYAVALIASRSYTVICPH